jgi:hypothetical protein
MDKAQFIGLLLQVVVHGKVQIVAKHGNVKLMN